MSLSIALSNALSGLNVSQAGLATVSQNVANANTIGYSRQVISLQQRIIGGVLNGVEVASINRIVDSFLVRELQSQASALGAAAAAETFFNEIQARFGTTANDSTSSANLADFAAAIESLATNPEDQALRFEVVAAGIRLANGISELATSVQKLRAEADRKIKAAVDTINAELIVVKDLNDRISRAQVNGESSSSLEDLRDRAVATIAANISITTFARDNGQLSILTSDGKTLLDQQLRQLEYSTSALVKSDTVFSPITIFAVDSVTGEKVGAGEVIVTGGTSDTAVSTFDSGRIKGLLAIRDGTLHDLAAQVESFAAAVRDGYNAIHNTGTSFPAPNTLTGTRPVSAGDPFSGTGTVRIAVVDGSGAIVGPPLDLDLAALGAITVGDLAATIDAALGANATAAIVNGKLEITATDGANGIAINEGDSQAGGTTQAFSDFFGLNDFFAGTAAADFSVRTDIMNDPSLLSVGLLSPTAVAGETGIAIGDNRVALKLAAFTEESITFAAVGGLPAGSYTIADYAAAITGLNAVQAASAFQHASLQRDLFNNLEFRTSSISGVNIDEEMVNMIVFEQAFAASARVLNTTAEMFDVLINLVR